MTTQNDIQQQIDKEKHDTLMNLSGIQKSPILAKA